EVLAAVAPHSPAGPFPASVHLSGRIGKAADQCELVHVAVAQLRVLLLVGNRANSTGGNPMQRSSFKLASQANRKIATEPSLSHWGFAAHAAMALIVIVLLTLTSAALEIFLSGDESLSALEAAISASTKPGPTK